MEHAGLEMDALWNGCLSPRTSWGFNTEEKRPIKIYGKPLSAQATTMISSDRIIRTNTASTLSVVSMNIVRWIKDSYPCQCETEVTELMSTWSVQCFPKGVEWRYVRSAVIHSMETTEGRNIQHSGFWVIEEVRPLAYDSRLPYTVVFRLRSRG